MTIICFTYSDLIQGHGPSILTCIECGIQLNPIYAMHPQALLGFCPVCNALESLITSLSE